MRLKKRRLTVSDRIGYAVIGCGLGSIVALLSSYGCYDRHWFGWQQDHSFMEYMQGLWWLLAIEVVTLTVLGAVKGEWIVHHLGEELARMMRGKR